MKRLLVLLALVPALALPFAACGDDDDDRPPVIYQDDDFGGDSDDGWDD